MVHDRFLPPVVRPRRDGRLRIFGGVRRHDLVGPFLIRMYLAFLFMLSSFGADSVSCACLSSTLRQATESLSIALRIDSDLSPSQSHRRDDSPNGLHHLLASPDSLRNNRAPCVLLSSPGLGHAYCGGGYRDCRPLAEYTRYQFKSCIIPFINRL